MALVCISILENMINGINISFTHTCMSNFSKTCQSKIFIISPNINDKTKTSPLFEFFAIFHFVFILKITFCINFLGYFLYE